MYNDEVRFDGPFLPKETPPGGSNITMKIHEYQSHMQRRKAVQRQRWIIILLSAALCVIITVLAFLLLGQSSDPDPSSSNTSISSDLSSGSVSSDSESSSSASESAASSSTVSEEERAELLSNLSKDITDYLSGKPGRYSVMYINMDNGETVAYKAEIPMVAASSVKIAYNTCLYKKFSENAFSMEEEMAYNSAAYPTGDYEAGTGTIQNSANGTLYTIREVSRLSIRISDNCATNMVLRKLGGIDKVNDEFMSPISSVVNYRKQVSYTDYSGAQQNGRHRTSAQDLAKYTAELYRLYSENKDVYEGLIEDLCNTEYDWGIPAGLPSGTRVAHKIGFNTAYATHNDVGIVFGPEDYILCVMTESGNAETAKADIAEISRMVGVYLNDVYGVD